MDQNIPSSPTGWACFLPSISPWEQDGPSVMRDCIPLELLPDFPRSKCYQVMQVGSLETFCLLWSLLLGVIRWSQSSHL